MGELIQVWEDPEKLGVFAPNCPRCLVQMEPGDAEWACPKCAPAQ